MTEPFLKRHGGFLVLLAAYLLSLLIVDPRGDFPLNDDWVYARGCVDSARAGRLEMTRLESAWSFPQIILGSLAARAFGFSHAGFRAAGIIALVLSALILDAYFRRLGLSRGARFIGLGTWMFNPVAYVLSLSFMTDLPFMVFSLAACYCWDMAIATEKRRWLALAAMATMIATSQRQTGMLIPVAVCLVLFVRLEMKSRRLMLSVSMPPKAGGFQWSSVAGVGAIVLFFLSLSSWRAGAGAHQMPFLEVAWTAREYLFTAYRVALFLGLSSIAFLPILARPALSRRSAWMAVGLALGATSFGLVFLARREPPLFGNMISVYGLFNESDILTGKREKIFGTTWIRAFDLLGLLGILGMIVRFPGAPWARPRKVEVPCPPGAATGGFGGVLVMAGALLIPMFLVRGRYFDRYLLPTLPALWVALAMCGAVRTRVRAVTSVALLAALAAFSTTITSDYFRWNEARWEAAEALVRRGVAANRIRGGYEWFGTYGGPDNGIGSHPSCNLADFDYILSFSGRVDGFDKLGANPWRSIWPPHDRKIYVLKNRRPPDPRK